MIVRKILISCATSCSITVLSFSMNSSKAQAVGLGSDAYIALSEIFHHSMNGKMGLWSSSGGWGTFLGIYFTLWFSEAPGITLVLLIGILSKYHSSWVSGFQLPIFLIYWGSVCLSYIPMGPIPRPECTKWVLMILRLLNTNFIEFW